MKCPFVIKVCSKCKRILVANETNFRKCKGGKGGLRSNCRNCEKIYDKQYRKGNKDKIAKKKKEWYKENQEEIKDKQKQYRLKNPEKMFNRNNKRRKREENQGNGITKEQWLEMMQFFDWCCAYSGEVLNEDNRSVDHIIPLNKNGENEIWNCVPMRKSYNRSKYISDMLEWYIEQPFYSEERLNKIYKWIEYAKEKWEK